MPDPGNAPRSPLTVYPMDPVAGQGNRPGPALRKPSIAVAIAATLGAIYAVEGGYVNDPLDRGGATNYGITEKVARQAGYRGDMRYFPKHCTEAGKVCADAIYLRDYIGPTMAMFNVEPALGRELSDTAVNMGPAWAARFLKQELGLPIKGGIGAADVAAYRALQARIGDRQACLVVLNGLDERQRQRYLSIVRRNPTQKKYLKGWLSKRIGNVPRSWCGE